MSKKTKDPVIMNAMAGSLPEDLRPAFELNVTQEEYFYELARDMHRNGMLKSVDRFQLTNAAVIYDKLVKATRELDYSGHTQVFESGAMNVSAELSAYDKIHAMWLKCVAQLGLTPAAREKILKKPAGMGKPEKEQTGSGLVIGKK